MDPLAVATAPRAEAVVDLDAIAANTALLDGISGDAQVMAVVKADAYGHGLVPSARAALSGGATWLGVALPDEALDLRAAGIDARILTWLLPPNDPALWSAVVAEGVDVSASAPWAVERAASAARATGRRARLHLKADTGLGRGGAPRAEWLDIVAAATAAQADGVVEVVGVWSHLAFPDEPGSAVVRGQVEAFEAALADVVAAGLDVEVRHLAGSGATLLAPQTHFDLVRPGIAVYGLSPGPGVGAPARFGLRPAMTLRARLALVKQVPAGHGVSYGHEYTTQRATRLGLVPLGYADGIPRAGSNRAPVLAAGRVRPVAGRVCMDQFVLDLGDDDAVAGDLVVLFGPGDDGEPTAEDWANACGTIGYEIVTRVGPRVTRTYRGVQA